MYKNASYKEKYAALDEWFPSIIESVKKDLKNEHIKKDYSFAKKYLSSKNPNKLTTEELVQAYKKAIAEDEKGEELAELLTSRWLLKHSDIYDFFEQQLSRIYPDFTTIEELEMAPSQNLIELARQEFGSSHTYLFAVLNSVVFPADIFKQLHEQAQNETLVQKEQQSLIHENLSLENLKTTYETEIARLTDKYEKKLAGLQKKYVIDIESLKRQVAQLQRKLNEKTV